MAFTEADRVSIRTYLGFSALFLQADPRLERAITAVQAINEGGTRPDASSEQAIRATLCGLVNIETAITNLSSLGGVTSADKGDAVIDAVREQARLRMEGRRLVHKLARFFDTMPRSDVFSSAPQEEAAYPSLPFAGRSGYS